MIKLKAIILFVLAAALVSCSNNQKSVIKETAVEEESIKEIVIVGTWLDIQDRTWVFGADGKLKYENYPSDIREYSYNITETKLTVKIERGVQTYDISISADGKTLTLTGGRNFSRWDIAGPGWSENRLVSKR